LLLRERDDFVRSLEWLENFDKLGDRFAKHARDARLSPNDDVTRDERLYVALSLLL
jgi:hypothetical protein